MTIDIDLASQNQGLRFLTRLNEPFVDEQGVEPLFTFCGQ